MSLRRQTLGPVSTNELRAQASGRGAAGRKSMGMDTGRRSLAPPSRHGGAGGGKERSSRHSMAPGLMGGGARSMSMKRGDASQSMGMRGGRQSMSRRNPSMGGAGAMSRGNQYADPRPINDRSFQNRGIKKLIQFLAERCYDHPLSPRTLTHPTCKDFTDIFQFMVRCLDSKFRFEKGKKGKVVDEVPHVFRDLGYPITIKRAWLSSVGSPHTWPHLLAALMWLQEYLEYDEAANRDGGAGVGGSGMHDEDENEAEFFEYLTHAYDCFLSGDDAQYDELERNLLEKVVAAEDEEGAAVEDLTKDNEALKAELAKLKEAEVTVSSLEAHLDALNKDDKKYDAVVADVESRTKALEAKIAERREELTEKRGDLRDKQGVVADLQGRLQRQALSPADVQVRAPRELT